MSVRVEFCLMRRVYVGRNAMNDKNLSRLL